jgi:hypothetical protein
MGQVRDPNDHYLTGLWSFVGTVELPANSVEDATVKVGTQIDHEKLIHLHLASHQQSQAGDVVTARHIIHVCKFAATIEYVQVCIDDAPTGGDKQYTVDVRRSTGGGAWTTVLSAVVTVNSSSGNRTVVLPTVSVINLAAGDLLAAVVTASGSTGTQGRGLCVIAAVAERTL